MNDKPELGREQELLRHARRESVVIMAVWAVALVWSVGYAYFTGYRVEPRQITLILGMPSWVFWSVVLPWGICLLFSVWYCFVFMADDDLGQDPEERAGHD